MRQLILEKGKRFTFLVKNVTEIFSSWTKAKILGLNENYVHQLRYKQGDVIYDIGQPSGVFYIIKEGKAIQETIIEQETNMKYPKNSKSWEI